MKNKTIYILTTIGMLLSGCIGTMEGEIPVEIPSIESGVVITTHVNNDNLTDNYRKILNTNNFSIQIIEVQMAGKPNLWDLKPKESIKIPIPPRSSGMVEYSIKKNGATIGTLYI